jgi:hypothetical protein
MFRRLMTCKTRAEMRSEIGEVCELSRCHCMQYHRIGGVHPSHSWGGKSKIVSGANDVQGGGLFVV